ncbi:hypothetical protein HZS_8035, partial [Henneguya salminicola]
MKEYLFEFLKKELKQVKPCILAGNMTESIKTIFDNLNFNNYRFSTRLLFNFTATNSLNFWFKPRNDCYPKSGGPPPNA